MTTTPPPTRPALAPGLLLALGVAAVAWALAAVVPLVGAPVLALVLGVLLGTAVPAVRGGRTAPGLDVAARGVLQASIVVLGTGLSLGQVGRVGAQSLPVMVGTLAVALGGARLLAPRLRVGRDVALLVGVGTAICGASAIAAVAAVLRPRRSDVAYALGTIFVFNVAAVLAFPPLGHLLGMDAQAFGLWAGTAVNDTSSVVAAAYAYGADAGPYAVVVKLVRTLALVPLLVGLAWWTGRQDPARDGAGDPARDGGRAGVWSALPVFVLWFLLAVAANTLGLVPAGWHDALGRLGVLLVAVALAALGLTMRVRRMREAGLRPLVLGGVLWVAVAASSLALQAATGRL